VRTIEKGVVVNIIKEGKEKRRQKGGRKGRGVEDKGEREGRTREGA